MRQYFISLICKLLLNSEFFSSAVSTFRLKLKTCPARVEKALATVWELMAQGKIHPVIDMTYHYEQVNIIYKEGRRFCKNLAIDKNFHEYFQMGIAMGRMPDRKNIGKILIVRELQVVAAEEATTPSTGPTPAVPVPEAPEPTPTLVAAPAPFRNSSQPTPNKHRPSHKKKLLERFQKTSRRLVTSNKYFSNTIHKNFCHFGYLL